MKVSLKGTLLPNPPSYIKKKAYQLHEVLGTGTFGKVVVTYPTAIYLNRFLIFTIRILRRELLGTSQRSK